jgi:hypothetical protein
MLLHWKKKSDVEQSEGIAFEEIAFEDKDLVAIHVFTPASIYRLNNRRIRHGFM